MDNFKLDLYFSDIFFKDYLFEVNKKQKEDHLIQDASERLSMASFVALIILSISLLYLAYHKNLTYLNSIETSVSSITDNKITFERIRYLQNILNQKEPWQQYFFFCPFKKETLENYLSIERDNYIKVNIAPWLLSFIEDNVNRNLGSNAIYSTDLLQSYAMVIGIEDFEPTRVKDWYLNKIDSVKLPFMIEKKDLEDVITAITADFFKGIIHDDTIFDKIVSELNNYRFAKEVYDATKKKLQGKEHTTCNNFLIHKTLAIFEDGFCKVSIPFIYTSQGYLDYIINQESMLKKILSIKSITQKLNMDSIKKSIEETNYDYIRDYSAHWNNFLSKISLKKLPTLEAALDTLQIVSLDHALLLNFSEQMNNRFILPEALLNLEETKLLYQIDLNMIDRSSLSNKVKELVQYDFPTNNLAASISIELTKVTKSLTELIHNVINDINPSYKSFEIVTKYENTSDSILKKADQFNLKLPHPIATVYQTLINRIKNLLYDKAASYIDELWEETIFEFYKDKIQNKYPFSKNNYSDQISIRDFNDFFANNGILDHFIKDYLFLTGITPSEKSNKLLNFFHSIQIAWFGKSQKPQLRFIVIPINLDHRLSEVVLSIFGKRITFTNQNLTPVVVEWTGQDEQSQEQLKIEFTDKLKKTFGISYSGSWAWYRFFKLDEDSIGQVIFKEDKQRVVIDSPIGNFEFIVKFNQDFPLLSNNNFQILPQVINIED